MQAWPGSSSGFVVSHSQQDISLSILSLKDPINMIAFERILIRNFIRLTSYVTSNFRTKNLRSLKFVKYQRHSIPLSYPKWCGNYFQTLSLNKDTTLRTNKISTKSVLFSPFLHIPKRSCHVGYYRT